MDQFSGLAPEHQAIAGIAFLIAMGVLAAWSKFRGNKEGAPAPKVQEFYAAGQLADMGPVKELVEQMGLLIQQQIKTNVLQGDANVLIGDLTGVLKDHFEAQRRAEADRDLEEEIDRRARIAAEDIVRQREEEAAARRPQRKTT